MEVILEPSSVAARLLCVRRRRAAERKKAQQTFTFSARVPRGSRAAGLLHVVVTCSHATHAGAGWIARASITSPLRHPIPRALELVLCHG